MQAFNCSEQSAVSSKASGSQNRDLAIDDFTLGLHNFSRAAVLHSVSKFMYRVAVTFPCRSQPLITFGLATPLQLCDCLEYVLFT